MFKFAFLLCIVAVAIDGKSRPTTNTGQVFNPAGGTQSAPASPPGSPTGGAIPIALGSPRAGSPAPAPASPGSPGSGVIPIALGSPRRPAAAPAAPAASQRLGNRGRANTV